MASQGYKTNAKEDSSHQNQSQPKETGETSANEDAALENAEFKDSESQNPSLKDTVEGTKADRSAVGAESAAHALAFENGYDLTKYPPPWRRIPFETVEEDE